MCGRYSFAQLSTEVEKRFKIHVDGNTYVARYNCAPSQKLGVITNKNPHELSHLQWGLIPPWAKNNTLKLPLINARSESLEEKPAFRESLKSKPCLIPADGFYEWIKNGIHLIPYHIRMKNREAFAFAGLWEEWEDRQGKPISTFSIITTEANQLMQSIHNRMPVILPQKLEQEWLENPSSRDLKKMLKPYDSSSMEAFEISTKINKSTYEGADLIEPFENDKQLLLF
jgi:putative SOS response-associated peptidase YedK